MKTFKQFLSEDEDAQTIESFVNEHCKSYIDQAGIRGEHEMLSRFMVRGISLTGKEIYLKNSDDKLFRCYIKQQRPDRKPLNLNPKLSEIADAEFYKKFGWHARVGVFAFGTVGVNASSDYGTPHLVFPIGSLNYVWSPKVRDFMSPMSNLLYSMEMSAWLRTGEFAKDDLDKFPGLIGDMLDELRYTDKNLRAAIDSDRAREIMLDCSSYLCIPYTARRAQ